MLRREVREKGESKGGREKKGRVREGGKRALTLERGKEIGY